MGQYGSTKGPVDLNTITAKDILDYVLVVLQKKVGTKKYSEMVREIKFRIENS